MNTPATDWFVVPLAVLAPMRLLAATITALTEDDDVMPRPEVAVVRYEEQPSTDTRWPLYPNTFLVL